MDALLEGFLFGLFLTVMLGPVFFSIIQTALTDGFKHGAAMAAGVSLSDISYIFLCHIGISQISDNQMFQKILGIGGGIILLTFGAKMIFQPKATTEGKRSSTSSPKKISKFINGFLINAINPFVLIFWIGVASMASTKFLHDNSDTVRFYAAIIITVFSTDLLKIYLSDKIRPFITSHLIVKFNRIAGIALLFYGGRLLYYALMTESIHLT